MNTYVEINDNLYSASITGRVNDKDWDNRASKAITITMSYEDAVSLFVDDVQWYIVQENDDNTERYDNSEYSIAGDITDHRNGTITVKMGKPTAEELLAMLEGVL